MSTSLLPINTLTIRATGVSDNTRRKTTASAAGNNKWWGPIFGLSTDADYIDNNKISAAEVVDTPAKTAKFTPGCFTEEKAKQLRLRTKESFHDVMYHSAIASRLASDFSGKE